MLNRASVKMEDDDYEIIQEKGPPLHFFQSLAKDEKVDRFIPSVQSEDNFNENQTLQYFKEDETEIASNEFGSLWQTTENSCQSFPNVSEEKISPQVQNPFQGFKPEKSKDFVIIENATKCNSKKLYDSQGYSYTLRSVSVKEGYSIWRCRFKIDGKECGANIKIMNDEELVIVKGHRHYPDTSISFPILKSGTKNPLRYNPKRTFGKITSKNSTIPNVPVTDFELEEFHNFQEKPEECDKFLDYFSEGQIMDRSDDLDLLLSEHKEEDEYSIEQENPLQRECERCFKIVKNGSITGTHILYDSLGYSYSLAQKNGLETTWCCQVGHSTDRRECGAKVLQRGPSIFIVTGNHSHNPTRHTLLKIKKMNLFIDGKWSENCSKRKMENLSPSASPKKTKSTVASSDKSISLQNSNVKEKEENFQFNTRNMSFMVSFEEAEDEKKMSPKVNLEMSRDWIEDFPCGSKKNSSVAQMHLSHDAPTVQVNGAFPILKEMAAQLFSESPPHFMTGINYHILDGGSNQGSPKLYDSQGYFYTLRNNSSDDESQTNWFCCSRGEEYNCRGKVRQNMESFTVERDHSHPPDKEKYIRSLIRMEAIEMAKNPSNARRSGMSIVKAIIESYGFQFPFTINIDHLVRFVNYQKKSYMDQNEIANNKFSFNKKKIPKNFLLKKIMADCKYHLTFATENQLAYLAAATEWYVDEADFELAPFTNLLSIHIYTQQKDRPRQIPVFFALISDRQESDYVQIFASIKEALTKPPAVASVIIDLNVPLRKTLAKSFPSIEIKCCDLHWSEDISNKLKEMDLSSYNNNSVTMNYLRQLPLLNLLPRQIFETSLRKIETAVRDVSVHDLICYIRETFGERGLWPPKYWSSFKMPIQINHHQEWRKDIIQSGTPQEIYSFIRNLHLLSESLGDDLRLMSKKKIKKFYLSHPETILCQVYNEWKTYCKGENDCNSLLEKLASFIHTF